MNITIVQYISPQRLEEMCRKVTLKEKKDAAGNPICVYEKARILLREMHPEELNPGSKYVLHEGLGRQRELRKALLRDHGVDVLNLNGGYVLLDNETGKRHTLIPPVVEVTEESMKFHDTRGDIQYADSTVVKMNVIVDGLHRLYHGRDLDKLCKVLHVSDLSRAHPFYAVPNRWDEVRVLSETPPKDQKKNFRFENPYPWYRDFGVFGVGDPRQSAAKEEKK